MIDIAIDSFKKLPYIYYVIDAFYYLIKFKNDKVNELIQKHTKDKDDLIAYNAQRSLDMIKL